MIIKEKYKNRHTQLLTELSLDNVMALPGLEKVVVNVGIGKDRAQQGFIDQLRDDIATITGQKPVITKAKKAIAGFKLQKGQPVGLKVTLRRSRMFDFLTRLINAVLPAIRDFKGIPMQNIDRFGNLNIGLPEHTMFPEIGFEQIARAHGVQITIVPTTRDRSAAIALYKSLGIPVQDKEK